MPYHYPLKRSLYLTRWFLIAAALLLTKYLQYFKEFTLCHVCLFIRFDLILIASFTLIDLFVSNPTKKLRTSTHITQGFLILLGLSMSAHQRWLEQQPHVSCPRFNLNGQHSVFNLFGSRNPVCRPVHTWFSLSLMTWATIVFSLLLLLWVIQFYFERQSRLDKINCD